MTEEYKRRKANHLCVQCGAKDERTEQGFVRCQYCRDANIMLKRKRVIRRVSQGLCPYCGEKVYDEFIGCPECRQRATEYAHRRREIV